MAAAPEPMRARPYSSPSSPLHVSSFELEICTWVHNWGEARQWRHRGDILPSCRAVRVRDGVTTVGLWGTARMGRFCTQSCWGVAVRSISIGGQDLSRVMGNHGSVDCRSNDHRLRTDSFYREI